VCIYTGGSPTPSDAFAHMPAVEALADARDEALPSRTRTP
jgi:hypothetical protein